MPNPELTITVKTLRRLVDPVLPAAGSTSELPALSNVRIESTGKYLLAMATDRFRLAMHRVPADSDASWPEWSATIPLGTLRSIFQTYKPASRIDDPTLTLELRNGGLVVHGDTALLDLLDATVTYPLWEGEYPQLRSVIRNALANEGTGQHVGVNPGLIAGLAKGLPSHVGALTLRFAGPRNPIVLTDGDDYVGILMPRRLMDGQSTEFGLDDDWTALLAAPKSKKKSAA